MSSFKYDPFGRRIYKSSRSGTSIYAYDWVDLIEETNASGAAVARYPQGENIDEPLAVLRSPTTSYYEADGLGSVTTLSNAAGEVANNYTYDSLGNLVASRNLDLSELGGSSRETPFRELETQLEQLAVNTRRSPCRILGNHVSQVLCHGTDCRLVSGGVGPKRRPAEDEPCYGHLKKSISIV
jgi:YD repeat-containing protein